MKNGTKVFDRPDLGYCVKFYHDDMTNETTLKTVYYKHHWEKLMDQNQAERNMGPDGYKGDKTPGETDIWKAASLSAAVINHWKQEYGVDFYNPHHQDGVKKLLNDSNYGNVRTGEFKL